jgi:hypothetical protein
MYLEKVPLTDILDVRQIVDAYWQELMPHRAVVKHPERREV